MPFVTFARRRHACECGLEFTSRRGRRPQCPACGAFLCLGAVPGPGPALAALSVSVELHRAAGRYPNLPADPVSERVDEFLDFL